MAAAAIREHELPTAGRPAEMRAKFEDGRQRWVADDCRTLPDGREGDSPRRSVLDADLKFVTETGKNIRNGVK